MVKLIGVDLVPNLPRENIDIRDAKMKGFLIRCRRSGSHSYLFLGRRGRSVTIGRAGVIGVKEAREEARRALIGLSRGEDPVAGRRKRQRLTLAKFLDEHYEPWLLQQRPSAADTLATLRGRCVGLGAATG